MRITSLVVTILVSLNAVVIADQHWKLQPLKYNNPDLNRVDLGVGLWAWPMPMDYDGDGDLDLIVACPDKPSNGVYFFENPTQNPRAKLPVFNSGVRLGPAASNLQVSYVNGEPRVLQRNTEFPRFRSGDFETRNTIYPNVDFHPGQTRAQMWRYVDFEADGDHDLIVGIGDWTDYGWDHAHDNHGHWRNGRLHGYVYLIENNGTDAEPVYSGLPRRLKAAGGDIDVYGWPSPNFADFDRDGRSGFNLRRVPGWLHVVPKYWPAREEPMYARWKKTKQRRRQAAGNGLADDHADCDRLGRRWRL